jgi:hypothetical protein
VAGLGGSATAAGAVRPLARAGVVPGAETGDVGGGACALDSPDCVDGAAGGCGDDGALGTLIVVEGRVAVAPADTG